MNITLDAVADSLTNTQNISLPGRLVFDIATIRVPECPFNPKNRLTVPTVRRYVGCTEISLLTKWREIIVIVIVITCPRPPHHRRHRCCPLVLNLVLILSHPRVGSVRWGTGRVK